MLTHAGITFEQILAFSQNAHGVPPELVDNFVALGTPGDVIEQTARMLQAGVDQICFGHPLGQDLPKAIKLIGEGVLPHFAGA